MRAASKFRPRTKPPAERRDELMNAARRLFLKQGVAPTTIEQITSGADVAKGTFYLYFSSKEDVLAALGERFAQELLATIKAGMESWRHGRGPASPDISIQCGFTTLFFTDRGLARGKVSWTTSSSTIFPGCCRLALTRERGRLTTLVSRRCFCLADFTASWMPPGLEESAWTEAGWRKN